METLIELLRKSTDFLSAKGVENARLNAELLFAEVLGCKRLDLYLMFERPMIDADRDAIRPLVVRRGKHEPLQYILGYTEFFGLRLKCDKRALIPRPETEELAARVTERLVNREPARILDLGTGSGALALALAKAFPKAEVLAVDASASALELATENAESHGLERRVSLMQSDWFRELEGQAFDLIVSNPPYLTKEEWESAEPEVQAHEPKEALVGDGEDGSEDLRRIIVQAPNHLKPGGILALETGIAQHPTLKQAAGKAGFSEIVSEVDDCKRPRYILAKFSATLQV